MSIAVTSHRENIGDGLVVTPLGRADDAVRKIRRISVTCRHTGRPYDMWSGDSVIEPGLGDDAEYRLWTLRRQLGRLVEKRACGWWLDSDERDYQQLAAAELRALSRGMTSS